MIRLKQLLIILSFSFVSVEMEIIDKRNFTSEWLIVTKDSLYPPLVTKVKDHLVYVSFPSDFTIKLETSKIVNKPCEIPASKIKEYNGKNITPVYVEALGNGKVIISLLASKKGMNVSNVWLYVIDPQRCSHDFNNFTLDTTIASARDVMTVVPYQDSFDIFVKSNIYCELNTICSLRYSDKAVFVSLKKSGIPYDDESWDISTVKDHDPDEGYIYIAMVSKYNETMVSRFDSNLEIIARSYINIFGSIAYWYGEDGSASLCFGISDQEIKCFVLYSQHLLRVQVTLLYESYVQYYSIFRLRYGEAIVLTILSSDPDGSDSATYVQYIDTHGKVSAPVLFQEFICENVYEMNTFEVKKELFCASIMCQNIVNTKCIGSAEGRDF